MRAALIEEVSVSHTDEENHSALQLAPSHFVRNKKKSTFCIRLDYSPVLVRVARGVYGLRGIAAPGADPTSD